MEDIKKFQMGFFISLFLIVSSALLAYGFQTDFGDVDVQTVALVDANGNQIVGKLYRPSSVNSTQKAPAVLGLHGYNNDKDVMRPFALELAKAGIVVLCIDVNGHGDSEGTLPEITSGLAAANMAYGWLQSQSFVDGTKMGIYGHSMGYIEAYYLAMLFRPDHDALACISFATIPMFYYNFSIFHNVLHLQAEYEEFLRDGMNQKEMTDNDTYWMEIMSGVSGAKYDVTYGDFALGTAYRTHRAPGITHPGLSANSGTVKEVTAWMLQALSGKTEEEAMTIASQQTYVWLETFGLIALISMFVSVVFLFLWLLKTPFFRTVEQPLPKRLLIPNPIIWWSFTIVNIVAAGLAFIFFTHADVYYEIQTTFPLYNMGVINNWLGFYVILIMVSVAITIVFLAIRIITDRKGISADDFAITYPIEGKKRHWDWIVFLKTLLMVAILFGYMYIISALSQVTLNIELRGFWTFAKIITPQRMVKFFMYLPFFLLFYLINGGLSLFGWMRVKEAKNPVMTQLKWWLTACLIMVTGLLIVFAIQYLGFVFGYGPTFNRAPASADPDRIIWLFAPMMPLQLLSFIPMTMLILFGMTLFFRKTGRIYLGSILGALITTWFFVVGTVIGYGI